MPNPNNSPTPVPQSNKEAAPLNGREAFFAAREKINAMIGEFDSLVKDNLISKEIAKLYQDKLTNNLTGGTTLYDDLDAPISVEMGKIVVDAIRNFASSGYSPEAVKALAAIGTGKGGAQGIIDFARLLEGKSTEQVLASLKDSNSGWRSTITYLYRLQDESGNRIFKGGLEELFSPEELEGWQASQMETEENYRRRHTSYRLAPLLGNQISAEEYSVNPFQSGEMGQRAAAIIAEMPLRPGGYCLQNTQNALNRAGFSLGNMGKYATKSLPILESSRKFVEVVGTKQELQEMIENRVLPEGTVVFSTKHGDDRGEGGEPYGDTGIIVADGRIVGYDRGSLGADGKPKLVYGSGTDVLRVFIPKV